jgi:hypothetical protein
MSGRIIFDGDGAPPAPAALARMSLSLMPWGSSPSGISSRRVAADGSFVSAEYRPGRYTIGVGLAPAGWVTSSVKLRGRDMLAAPLELESTDLADVVLTLTNRLATAIGVVRTREGRPDPDATVVIVRARSTYLQGRVWPALVQVRVAADGSFTVPGLLPGEYDVVAVDDAALDQRMNAQLHAALIGASRRITVSVTGNPPLIMTAAPMPALNQRGRGKRN